MRHVAILAMLVGCLSGFAFGQAPTTLPDAAAVTTQPTKVDESYQARVIKVVGRATYSLSDDQGARTWQPAKVGDQLPAGTQVRTSLRSKLVLAFGEDSVVVVQQLTLSSIDQFHRSADTKVVRLGLGHGLIRAGVAETTLRSDMTIETPTATLSKKGTMDFGIQYEPSTGRFRVFLDQDGMIEALNKLTDESRTVLPGQYVTQAMHRWIDTASMDRWIPVVDTFGMTDAEEIFNRLQGTGLGVVEPGGGSTILAFSGRDAGRLAAALAAQRVRQQIPTVRLPITLDGRRIIDRPEGNFGTGSGIVSSPLFKKLRRR